MTSEYPGLTAEMPDGQTIDIPKAQWEALDAIQSGEDTFHVISGNKGYTFELLEFDAEKKTFSWAVEGRVIQIRLRNPVESLVHSMGLERVVHDKIDAISAPMPGLVLDIKVKPGETVEEGAPLVILEAMKMENVIAAPNTARITEIHVTNGEKVDKGQRLLTFD